MWQFLPLRFSTQIRQFEALSVPFIRSWFFIHCNPPSRRFRFIAGKNCICWWLQQNNCKWQGYLKKIIARYEAFWFMQDQYYKFTSSIRWKFSWIFCLQNKKEIQNKKGVLVKKTRVAIRNLIFFYPFYELYTSACIWFFLMYVTISLTVIR